jgi:hypothetical protein
MLFTLYSAGPWSPLARSREISPAGLHVTGSAERIAVKENMRRSEKGGKPYLGPNLLFLRGHGFNSSAAPPPGSRLPALSLRILPAAPFRPTHASHTRHPNPQHRAHTVRHQRTRVPRIPTYRLHHDELKSPIREFKQLAPQSCRIAFIRARRPAVG